MKKKSNTVQLSAVGETDVFVNYVEIERSSPENQNETHIHGECEIYVNLSGDVDFEVENRIYNITRGSVIITRPYEYHHCIYRSDCLHRHYWVLIGGQNDAIIEHLFGNRDKDGNLIRLSENELTELSGFLDTLLSHGTSALNRQIALLRAVELLSSHASTSESLSATLLPKDVLYALKYMDEHIAEPIDTNQLAKCSFVSINTLERHFKKYFSLSPFAMLRKKRLLHSARLLREGASVSEACEQSGFSDYSNYIATFRSFFGITPLKYKQNVTN